MITWILWPLRHPKLALAALVGLIILALKVALYAVTLRLKKAKAALKEAKAYKTTREKIDEAPVADDPDAAREWLHARSKRKP